MPIEFKTHDDILAGSKEDLVKTAMVFTIGEKGALNRKGLAKAVLSWRALKIERSTAVMFHFAGYDDDPRELWHIPEVCSFVQKFCAKTSAQDHPSVEPMSRGWVLACISNVTVEMVSEKEALDNTMAFISKKVTDE